MRYPRHRTVVLLALLLSAAPVGAQIRDEGKFFSPQAVERANQQIAQMERAHGKQLVIETYPTAPAELREAIRRGEKQDVAYGNWVSDRALAGRVDGILGVITQDPRYLSFGVGQRTQARAFTLQDRDELVRRMREALRSNDADRGLLDAVNFVNATLSQNLGAAAAAGAGAGEARGNQPAAQTAGGRLPGPTATPAQVPVRRGISIMSILFWGAMILGGIWLLRRLMGGRRPAMVGGGYGQPGMNQPIPPNDPRYGNQAGGPYGNQQPGYGGPGYGGGPAGGGGAFGRGVGGGLLGGLAGGYLYDRMFRGGQGGAAAGGGAAPTDQQASTGAQAGDDAGQGFSSSGGDFGGGDSGGGGDAGGGGDF